ncbi:TFIID-18kDa-domain-containing protein [Atractiella rhizophila]|nr:TFIID-18kDa-domain-containing protein [Atractiella rhizophila]
MASTASFADPEKRYKYSTEIAQMMFVFGEVRNPSKEVVRYIEDVVRSQVVEIVIQARGLAQRRNSRYISVEDLIFLIRNDKGKVNRLRTYLSWKDVRKKAKDSDNAEAANDLEETLEESIGATGDSLKAKKLKIKISWDVTNIFTSNIDSDSEDEQDDDEIAAWEDSKKRLKEADELTRNMTKEEYQYYSDCRQASFTYKKSKRFKEFVQFANLLEVQSVNDEVIDVLGFLCYEMVQVLCEAAFRYRKEGAEKKQLAIQEKKRRDEEKHQQEEAKIEALVEKIEKKRARDQDEPTGGTANKKQKSAATPPAASPGIHANTIPTKAQDKSSNIFTDPQPLNHDLPLGLFSAPVAPPPATAPASPTSKPDATTAPNVSSDVKNGAEEQKDSLFTPSDFVASPTPPEAAKLVKDKDEAKDPLQIEHLIGAFTKMQREKSMAKMGGFRNFRGGLTRTRVGII